MAAIDRTLALRLLPAAGVVGAVLLAIVAAGERGGGGSAGRRS